MDLDVTFPATHRTGKFRDLTGQKFGRLSVICFVGHYGPRRRLMWRCRCDCGDTILMTGASLTTEHAKSCGCIYIERASALGRAKRKHGHWSGSRASPEYAAWQSMKQRCSNKKTKNFNDYGGRGIKVCKRWLHSFENFLKDMGPRPSLVHSLDRIEVNGDYEPTNCRWADSSTQSFNRRNNCWITIRGRQMLLVDAVAKLGKVALKTARDRLHRGWDPEIAITTPMVLAKDRQPIATRRKQNG